MAIKKNTFPNKGRRADLAECDKGHGGLRSRKPFVQYRSLNILAAMAIIDMFPYFYQKIEEVKKLINFSVTYFMKGSNHIYLLLKF